LFAITTVLDQTPLQPPHNINRREFLSRASAIVASGLPLLTTTSRAETKVPLAQAFDGEMEQFMAARKIPGGALAVVKDGRLVYSRGYGHADRENKEPVKPESLFRIASISKPFTAVAVLKLVELKKLDLDAPIVGLLGIKRMLLAGKEPDERMGRVTVRHCLHHTGGWDRQASGDPMFRSKEIALAMDVPAPAMPEAVISYMLGRPLDFDPGTRFVYSNFGYCLLGRLIEKASGLKYDQFVRREVLEPLRISKMRLGASLAGERVDGEVKYYTPTEQQVPSVLARHPGKVPLAYGGFCLEAMDSHGGWLASAVDLARFAAGLDAPDSLLRRETKRTLYEPPGPPVSRDKDGILAEHYYGCGWSVRTVGKSGKANYWHNGSLPGTFTLLVRRFDGLSWAALFNQRSEDSKLPDDAIDRALHRAADAVAEWPDHDLFS
jgi:CubicO group peptidase (beta-lactamase class C family)